VLHRQTGIEPFFLGGLYSRFRRAKFGAFGKKTGGLCIVPCNSDGKRVVCGHRDE
jgi:hypothetical protein